MNFLLYHPSITHIGVGGCAASPRDENFLREGGGRLGRLSSVCPDVCPDFLSRNCDYVTKDLRFLKNWCRKSELVSTDLVGLDETVTRCNGFCVFLDSGFRPPGQLAAQRPVAEPRRASQKPYEFMHLAHTGFWPGQEIDAPHGAKTL